MSPHTRDLWPVKADLSQFEQVIVNLAVNARDAMPDGGKLSLRTANVSAAEMRSFSPSRACRRAEYVRVDVADTGTGIPPDIIDRIFEPFFSTKEVNKGTGLGLSTVYGIIKQTGGFIYPESEVGRGTTFHIFLPRHIPDRRRRWRRSQRRRPPSRCPPTTPATAPSCWWRTRRACAASMRAASPRAATRCCRPPTASRRIEAIDRHSGKIDLVVSDVVMPEMDGPTLLKELRGRDPGVKIIFVSGYAEEAFAKNLPDEEKVRFPRQAVHAQAVGGGGEGDDRQVGIGK